MLNDSHLSYLHRSASYSPVANWLSSCAREHGGWQFLNTTSHSAPHQRGADLYSLHLPKLKNSKRQL